MFRRCTEFFRKISQSAQLASLLSVTQALPDFEQHSEMLLSLQKNLEEYRYQNTDQISMDLVKFVNSLIKSCQGQPSEVHQKVVDFQIFFENEFEELNLINEEIYSHKAQTVKPTVQEAIKQPRPPVSNQPAPAVKGNKILKPVQKPLQ